MNVPRQRARHRAPDGQQGAQGHPEEELAVLLDRLHGPDRSGRAGTLRELAALADACPELRQEVVTALCAWLRAPWDLPGGEPGSGPAESLEPHEPESRRLGIGIIAARLRDPAHPATWTGLDLDLAGAVLTGADFSSCWFTAGQVRFEGAWCIEGRMSFAGAHFSGACVSLRHWTSGQGDLDFSGSRITAGVVTLAGAVLDSGFVTFSGAVVDGGVVAFTEARVRGATIDLSDVTVSSGVLSLADAHVPSGRVLLMDARLLGGVTALRDADIAPGVLAMSGAQAASGALMVRSARGDLRHRVN